MLDQSPENSSSTNRALHTVHTELRRKIEELNHANIDLANLFASIHIPAIFLHTGGLIARFTPAAMEEFGLVGSDIGQPIATVITQFRDINLTECVATVLRTLVPYEAQVYQHTSDAWWTMHIRPYRTLARDPNGIVLTFADITARVQTDAMLQQEHDVLEQRVRERTSELATANTALQAEIAERKQAEQSRQQLLQQLVTAQEEERRRVARELHDQLGQDVTALILGLKALHDTTTGDARTAERVRQLQELAMQLGQEVRTLAVQLRPTALDDLGLYTTLENYVEQWSARALVAVDFHSTGLEDEHLPLAVETTLYRLVQEGLTNILKHAEARNVSLIIHRHATEVRMIIEDDGVGFDMAAEYHKAVGERRLGLVGMAERVALLSGTLTIESAPGSGTTIFVRIPLADGA